jgi:branched-chain amino acid transport system substrate-binding protein
MIRRASLLILLTGLSLMGLAAAAQPAPLRIGALFPLTGPLAAAAGEERLGVEVAAQMVNAEGGVAGRPIALEERDLSRTEDAAATVDELRNRGVPVVIGTYSSSLSLPASAAASADGLLYWETGAVADQVTGRGLPGVYRVGATGSQLGGNSANFAAADLAARLQRTPATTRVVVVNETDAYGTSVAAGALDRARELGLDVVGHLTYDAYAPDFDELLPRVAALQPDVIILASFIGDGVGFRHAMLTHHVHAGALIGSTMAECVPEYGALAGPDAVGVFGSDRPGYGFDPTALAPAPRAVFARFAEIWAERTAGRPDEEAIAGFSGAWALFHDVLRHAGRLDARGIAAAADSTAIAAGGLPNGAGLRFSQDPATHGQNLEAAAMIWQWQAVRTETVVWPPQYATGEPVDVPLAA